MNPSNFTTTPVNSILGKRHFAYDITARNIMKILERTGNQWRQLSWQEYKAEMNKDNNRVDGTRPIFDDIAGMLSDEVGTRCYCCCWGG